MTSKESRAALRELAARATKLPYEVDIDRDDTFDGNYTIDITNKDTDFLAHFDSGTKVYKEARETREHHNAQFIVAAVNALPDMLDDLDAAERVIEAARAYLRDGLFPDIDPNLNTLMDALAAWDSRGRR